MRLITFAVALALAAGSASGQSCGWSDHFDTRVLGAPVLSPIVYSQLVVDNGAAVIIGGQFNRAGSLAANAIARWDGSTFQTFGSGLTWDNGYPSQVRSLAMYQPAGAPQPLVIAGGSFNQAGGAPATNLAVWNGAAWHGIPGTPTGNWLESTTVNMLAVADPDGDGPLPESLIVSLSLFYGYGPGYSDYGQLWAWDGTSWTRLAPGSANAASSVSIFGPSGATPCMYTTGESDSGGCGYSRSTSLLRLESSGDVTTLISGTCDIPCYQNPPCQGPTYSQSIVFDPGSGPRLILLGSFDSILGVPAHNLASFDGSTWSQFASGADGVRFLFTFTDPATGRPSLYAAGANLSIGGITAPALARLDSTGWTSVATVTNASPSSIVPFAPPGVAPSLLMNGILNAGVAVPGWSRLTPYGWAPIGQCLNNEVHTLATYTPPGGTQSLYAGGAFTIAAGQLASSFARWDGTDWHPAVSLNNHVDCMARFGQYLALGGKFTLNGLSTGGVGIFDGQTVTPLGSGMNTPVHALASFNGQLYAGGEFTIAGGVSAIGIARWNGSAWAPLTSGVNNHVDALAVYDDGSGPALYIGGKFTAAGGQTAPHIARWTGSAWSSIPGGNADGNIEALTVMGDGSGSALYLGGDFSHIGSVPASRVARFRNGAFTALASDMDGTVRALSSIDPDGPGKSPALLVAAGTFTHIDALQTANAAIWNGHSWTPLQVGNTVYALAPFQAPGTRPAMYFGGGMGTVDAAPTSFIADYTPCSCYANCDASTSAPLLNVNDFICFLNLFAAASPAANCDGSTTPPALNVADFNCFLNAFAAGCP